MATADNSPCTVQRRCSSAGLACEIDDRTCQSKAVEHGLEITCENPTTHGYVYCPPGAEQRDSNVVWILLSVAVLIAAFGIVIAYVVFRATKKTEADR